MQETEKPLRTKQISKFETREYFADYIKVIRSNGSYLIDLADEQLIDNRKFKIKTWSKISLSYVCCSRDGYANRLHRILMNIGSDDKMQVDHINQNTLDNRRANLRLATNAENSRNRKKPKRDCVSQFKGVTLQKIPGRGDKVYCYWLARIWVDGKSYSRYARSELEAARFYNDLATQHHGAFASLNKIPLAFSQDLSQIEITQANKEMQNDKTSETNRNQKNDQTENRIDPIK